jgi:hypothetical protein
MQMRRRIDDTDLRPYAPQLGTVAFWLE